MNDRSRTHPKTTLCIIFVPKTAFFLDKISAVIILQFGIKFYLNHPLQCLSQNPVLYFIQKFAVLKQVCIKVLVVLPTEILSCTMTPKGSLKRVCESIYPRTGTFSHKGFTDIQKQVVALSFKLDSSQKW